MLKEHITPSSPAQVRPSGAACYIFEDYMETSYFAKYKKDNGISIAGKAPEWFTGRQYKKLAPKYWFFQKYKTDGDEAFYIEQYQKEVLDPKHVFEELGKDAVLLCWEKSGEFCHRRLVVAWLEKHLGIKVPEI